MKKDKRWIGIVTTNSFKLDADAIDDEVFTSIDQPFAVCLFLQQAFFINRF